MTGDIRAHRVGSRRLGQREVVVYLPPGYSERDNWSYPFALLHDGQNIFDVRSAVFGVEWGVDETAERLIVEGTIEPIILIAVYNTPRRIAEYTPFPDPEHGGGQAALYKAFILEELIPFLQRRYRLTNVAENRAVIGSSLGGLVSLYLGWTAHESFGMVGALSPSLWWGRRGFITSLAGAPPPSRRPRIWLDAGTHETATDGNDNGIPDLLDDLRTLKAVLLSHGYQESVDLSYREVEGATHDEASWSKRVEDVLTFMFARDVRFRV